MQVFSWDDVLNSKVSDFIAGSGTALTVGGFDGPHRGHEVLCAKVVADARKRALLPGLITFKHSPRAFKQQGAYEGDISTLRLRLKVFKQWGFAFAVVIDFSSDFSKMEGYTFLTVLKDYCGMRFFEVGKLFRCGHNHTAGEDEIRKFAGEHGIECDFVSLAADGGSRISSSAVRRYIRAGKLDKAAQFLGRPFEIDCLCLSAENEGGKTVALKKYGGGQDCFQILPPDGVYRVNVSASDAGKKIGFAADLHAGSSVLRLDVPDVYKKCRFDTIRFKN